MLATLAAAALICVASALVGEGIARVLGLERGRGWSAAVGLATLMAVSLAAVKLPGHGTTGAIVLVVVVVLAAVVLLRRGGLPRPGWDLALLSGATALAACVPYLSNGRFGILALSFNNDMSAHIPWVHALQDPDMPAKLGPTSGYPIGPHSLVAALASLTGLEIEELFAGLLVALVVLIGWAALPLLDGLSRPRRLVAALLVAVAYTVSAFYAQAGFKELTLTLFLLALLAIAREAARHRGTSARVGVQLGLLGAGTVISFSYGGLAWALAALAAWTGLAAAAVLLSDGSGLRIWLRSLRRAVPIGLYAIAAGVVALASDLPRLIDSLSVFGASPSGTGALTSSGHLAGEISKQEVFGFWPREDFRFGFEHTALNEALLVLAVAVAVYGGLWWLLRRDLALPAAVAAAMAIAIYLSRTESAYTASKALAPAGALVMLMSARAILADPPPLRRDAVRLVLAAAAGVFVLAALWSSFLVLRGAQVGPTDHSDDLATLAPRLAGQPTLFLGNDDFARAELPGVPLVVQPTARPGKRWSYGDPFDFDSVTPAELDAVAYVIAPRTAFRSDPPPNLRRVATAGSYELWQRRGSTPPLRILAEGDRPGALLDCATPAGRALARRAGWARVWPAPPRVRMLPSRLRGVPPGGSGSAVLALPRGDWELSLQYAAPQELTAQVGGGTDELPANLDRPGPYWRIGDRRGDGSPLPLELAMEDDELGAGNHYATLLQTAAVRTDAPHATVPLRAACGRYVDWYTLGTAPPGAG